LFSSLFWKDFAERLIATLAQVALGLLTADGVGSVSAEVWLTTLLVAGLAVFLKCLAAAGIDGTVSPASFAPARPDLPAVSAENTGSDSELFIKKGPETVNEL